MVYGAVDMRIAERIREARLAAGFTSQESFARALKVDRKTPQRWEVGKNTPSLSALRAISDVTGHPIEFFLTAMAEDEEEELVSKMAAQLSHDLTRLVREAVKQAVADQTKLRVVA